MPFYKSLQRDLPQRGNCHMWPVNLAGYAHSTLYSVLKNAKEAPSANNP